MTSSSLLPAACVRPFAGPPSLLDAIVASSMLPLLCSFCAVAACPQATCSAALSALWGGEAGAVRLSGGPSSPLRLCRFPAPASRC